MGRLWRATEEGTEERSAVVKMVDLWGETYEACREKIGAEFPGVGEYWDTMEEIRERRGLEGDLVTHPRTRETEQ
jgi:hypothetical protein